MKYLNAISLSALLLTASIVTTQAHAQTAKPNPVASTTDPKIDTDGDGIPDIAEALLGTDPLLADTTGDGFTDKTTATPLKMANPIPRGGKLGGLTVVSGKAEDNADPVTNKDVSDHIELEVKNLSSSDIKGISLFITIKDDDTGKSENYYRKLPGYIVAKGMSRTLHFDINGTIDFSAATDHFRANPNSSFYKTINPKTIEVEIAATDYAPAAITFKKSKGGAETAD